MSTKLRSVRVSNPADIQGLVVEPAKTVGAFAIGATVGGFVTGPISDAIDDRIESAGTRGAVKLAAATLLLGGVALAAESATKKSSSKHGPLIAAASVGACSGLIADGLRDLTGRGQVSADYIDVEAEDSSEEMGSTVVDMNDFRALPPATEMSGFASSNFNRSAFASFS